MLSICLIHTHICRQKFLAFLWEQVQDFLEVLKKPYEEQPGKDHWREASRGGIRRGIEMLSCSS
jgi:hypothetical protein